jgi:hypothetical protein
VEEAGAALAESMPLLRDLNKALQQEDIGTIRRILGELKNRPLDSTTKERLNSIDDKVMMAEFEDALAVVKELF